MIYDLALQHEGNNLEFDIISDSDIRLRVRSIICQFSFHQIS